MSKLESILIEIIKNEASDLHIISGLPPIMRKNTELIKLDFPVIHKEEVKEMVIGMTGPKRFEQFEKKKDIDCATYIDDSKSGCRGRFRVNAHYQRGSIAISFRTIPTPPPDINDLNLPPIVQELADLPRGLVLVTGHTGSGKSTSLASIIELINSRVSKHIITLEDPVEYTLDNKLSIIEQREIGDDCLNFASGLRHVLRQDPDIIMVGEMRDLETTSSTITAAETGHLVFSTLHTMNASQTVERIIDIYPPNQQNQIRTMLANTLEAVISQTLFKRMDKTGMVPCVEILLCNTAVRNCIRENRIYEIPNIIETSRKLGMQTMDHSIADMYSKGFIDRDEAILRSISPSKMEKTLAPAAAKPELVSSNA